MYRIILLTTLAALAVATAEAHGQIGGPAAPQSAAAPSPATPSAAEPMPAPDAARLWRGTITYRVSVGADTTGADTAVWSVRGAELSAVDRMHVMRTVAVVESRMALPSFSPIASTETRAGAVGASESRIAYVQGRARGTLAMGGRETAVDDEAPAGTYDFAALPALIAALPLRSGAVWTVPAYAPYVRRVKAYRVEVAAVETVGTPMGPVRAYRVAVTGGMAPMLFWFSEAEPRWEVRGEVPAMGVTIEPRSRTP
ncbi:MAG TPA: DUF3108 domain-containing protein [Longimicrobium sp.]|nr:DUF3108 domain-containing protein [Longimicrobium sp.]